MDDELQEIRIKKVLGPTNTGTAVILGNDEKTFVMFIGIYEGAAIIRELNGEEPARPLTHELITSIFAGFSVEVKRIVISDIVKNTFCATLVLEQKCVNESGDWNGLRNEVHIDARPSDCLVLALKSGVPILVSPAVLEQVRDIAEDVNFSHLFSAGEPETGDSFGLKDLKVSGLDDLPDLGVDDDDDDDDEDEDDD